MEQSLQPAKPQLPKVEDLFSGEHSLIKQNSLNVILNQNPPETWVKIHPVLKVKYLPIERVEYLLTAIFIEWYFEVKDIKLIGNSVVVVGTLFVTNPITGMPMRQDGIGASPLQTDKDAGAIDFNRLKSAAVMMAAPSAESFAIKDAAEKFGKLFGKDLNRKDQIAYDHLIEKYKLPNLNQK